MTTARGGAGLIRFCSCLLFALLTATAVHAQPVNDDCADAIDIGDGNYAGTTINATIDGNGLCGSSSSSPDVWYRYTAALDGLLSVQTCGSGYDTVLGLWTDCPGLGTETSCNDDSCGLQSAISAPVATGQVLYIRVSGFNGATGNFILDVQTLDPGDITGADVIYSDVPSITFWGTNGIVRAYSLGSSTCNIGDTNLTWGSTSPLLAMNAYRLYDGRLMQIGMSWVKNGTVAAANDGCGVPCNGQNGSVLGAGCRDVYSSGFNGIQGILGPRSQVNPFTGAYPGPSGGDGLSTFKRLQIHSDDLTQEGALYFVEGQYIAADDALANNDFNNASYKQVQVQGVNSELVPVGPMYTLVPAIYAWADHGLGIGMPDHTVQIIEVDVPEEGRFHVAVKVTELEAGGWRYDYAIRNLNSHRAAASFSVPVPPGSAVTNIGFHDVDYHSGEPYDNTDWNDAVEDGFVTWSSPESFEQNPDSNALRWGTMYNFWFDTDAAPVKGEASIALFRPGKPEAVTAAVLVPGATGGCPADVNGDGAVNVTDLVMLITSWGPCLAIPECPADINGDQTVDVTDLVTLITSWGPC